MSSPPPRSRAGTGKSRWCTAPGPSSRSDTSRPCSLPRWRTLRTHTHRRYTSRDPSSPKGIAALNSCRLQSHGHTHTPLRHTPPGRNSRPGSEVRSSFCRSSLPRRCSHTGQSWSCRGRCSLGWSLTDLAKKVHYMLWDERAWLFDLWVSSCCLSLAAVPKLCFKDGY